MQTVQPKRPKEWHSAYENLFMGLGGLLFVFFWFMCGFNFAPWTLVTGGLITLFLLFSVFMMGLTDR